MIRRCQYWDHLQRAKISSPHDQGQALTRDEAHLLGFHVCIFHDILCQMFGQLGQRHVA